MTVPHVPEHTTNARKSKHLRMLGRQFVANQKRWAGYSRTPAEHLLILTEEVGEVARSMQTFEEDYCWPPRYTPTTYDELVDAGAVILAMMAECES